MFTPDRFFQQLLGRIIRNNSRLVFGQHVRQLDLSSASPPNYDAPLKGAR